jgi:hypothetical protein
LQKWLFPILEKEIGELTEKQCGFVRVVELVDPVRFMRKFTWCSFGWPTETRLSIFKAFMAKKGKR